MMKLSSDHLHCWPALALAITFATSFLSSKLYADYNVSKIRTVEWLVDNSDVIVVVLGGNEECKGEPATIVQTLKGDASNIVYPLQKSSGGQGFSRWEPNSRGPARLVFIRGKFELLQAIKLARPIPNLNVERNAINVGRRTFGVSQYGDLLLTETALFDAIVLRLKRRRGQTLTAKKSSEGILRGSDHVLIHPPDRKRTPLVTLRVRRNFLVPAPDDFPFETTDETYFLIVPFTVERRDHFMRVLQTGNASARILAITELSYFDDEKATQAIRDVLTCTEVSPAFKPGIWSHNKKLEVLLTTEDVRAAAKRALDRIAD